MVETKAATRLEGIAEAFDDIRYYHEQGPELMALTQLHALTHLARFFYGATWDLSRKGLFNWRDEQSGDFETLVKGFVAPRRVLRVLSDYILFVRRDDQLAKAVLRPHQMRAAERCVARARQPGKRRGLIWHTQGSGKTFTMITVAKLLMADPALENPTVLLLIDRAELEAQLAGVLESVGESRVAVARSKRHLHELLAADRRGLIVSPAPRDRGGTASPEGAEPRQAVPVAAEGVPGRRPPRGAVPSSGPSAPQSNVSTVRATSPAFIARKASLMSSRRPRRVTISSSSNRPWR